MEAIFAGLLFLGLLIALPIISLARTAGLKGELERLRSRLDQLERRLGPQPPAPAEPAHVPAPAAAVEPTAPPPASSVAAPAPASPAQVAAAATVAGGGMPEPAGAAPVTPRTSPAPSAIAPPPPTTKPRDLEDLVGSVWLQNVGSVVVLLGVFFLILWGWTTGRFGPGVLLVAGIGLGLGVSWRGDRMRRSLPGIGHALIGVGLGIIYLSLYLGHFTLRVLPAPVAFASLVAAAALTVGAGLFYRVQAIAVLGVIGAFLPTALGAIVPLHGFSMSPPGLLGYLASVNLVVFALAARAGWSELALLSVALSAMTWIAMVPATRWSWPLEIGLAALFSALELAPIPRLLRVEGRVRPQDLVVIASAPLALIACSWPMWSVAQSVHVTMLLLSLTAMQFGAALYVDARRPERDLWRPLIAAAVIFLAAATERGLGTGSSPMAWTLEGVALTLLGLAPRAGWLRACGHVVTALGVGAMLLHLTEFPQAAPGAWPVWNPDGVRDAVTIAGLTLLSDRLHGSRERLRPSERALTGLWMVAAQLSLLLWSVHQVGLLAHQLEGPGGALRGMPDIHAAPPGIRLAEFTAAAIGLAWMLQSAWAVRESWRRQWPLLRIAGHAVGAAAVLSLLISLGESDGWSRNLLPVLHRDGLVVLAAAGLAGLTGAGLGRRRSELREFERLAAEIWAAGAALILLAWSAREADHVARLILNLPGASDTAWVWVPPQARNDLAAMVPSLTSVAWLVQALLTLAFGWIRRSAFLRWMGLVLMGVTTLKIVIVDLSRADPFWRFLAAIGAGAAMLAISYFYQRKRKRSPAAG